VDGGQRKVEKCLSLSFFFSLKAFASFSWRINEKLNYDTDFSMPLLDERYPSYIILCCSVFKV
jgi:hypothetical protein